MRSVTLVIMYTCIKLAPAKELVASHNGIDQKLSDRVASTSVQKANLDSSTLGKTAAAASATMNRLPTPMTSGQAGFGQLRAPVNQRTKSKVAAGLQETALAGTYGQAVFDIGAKGGNLEAMKDTMESLKVALDNVPDMYGVLTSPMLALSKKKDLVKGVIGEGPVTNFCYKLIDEKRMNILKESIETFETLYAGFNKIQLATVTSACELEESALLQIAKQVQSSTGSKSVKIKPVIDPSLIGGFIVDVNGQRIDLSLKQKLAALEAQMETTEAIDNLVQDKVPSR